MTSATGSRILVTGAAGFIGMHAAAALLRRGHQVIGVDDLCELYYPRRLKDMRLETLSSEPGFHFRTVDICDERAMAALVEAHPPRAIVHLAAHAAVPMSFREPAAYTRVNVQGTQAMLELARRVPDNRCFLYASSSSVYGVGPTDRPVSEDDTIQRPVSVYGATKIAGEALVQAYHARYGLRATGLRLFKVYGPWGRPDTVFFRFAERICQGQPVRLHNFGDIYHSFTYIDDVVAGILAALDVALDGTTPPAHRLYNLGNPHSVALPACLARIEKLLGRKATVDRVPLPPGDRAFTHADIARAERELGYRAGTPVPDGLAHFVRWYVGEYLPIGEPGPRTTEDSAT